MSVLVTIVLDSGCFLQNIDGNPSELDVGYFQSGKDEHGNDVADIRAYADAREAPVRINKLGHGRINVIRTGGVDPIPRLTISDSLKRNLLRKVDLYGKTSPAYNERAFDCVIHFASGDFRCSKVKNRRFVEVLVNGYAKTGNEKHLRPIAHDVLVHYLLADKEALRLERENGPVLFSTADLRTEATHIEIELLTNNATAEKFFCESLDLAGQTNCWLPNQGDPTSSGTP
jgi:hypothetical protein